MWSVLVSTVLISVVFSSITTLPISLIFLICFAAIFREPWIFFVAFVTGILLDIGAVRVIGQSSIFFITFLLMLFLYDRKFEMQSMPFIFLSTFLGSFGYLVLSGYEYILEQAVVSSVIAVILFKILSSKIKLQKEGLQLDVQS